MPIPQYMVLVLKLTLINTVSLNTVFSIPQNQCYPGNTCIQAAAYNGARTVFGLEFISWDSISTPRIYIGLKLHN